MTEPKYIPNYSSGEILVEFTEPCSHPQFVKALMDTHGYTFREYDDPGIFIVETPIGKEKKYCKKIEKQFSKYIEWADRRDLEYEERRKGLENLLKEVTDLSETVTLPEEDYNIKLENIKNKASLLKK